MNLKNKSIYEVIPVTAKGLNSVVNLDKEGLILL